MSQYEQGLNYTVLDRWVEAYGPFPRDYLAVDVETTGLSPDDVPVQIGWCEVIDGKPAHNVARVIDWTQHFDRAALTALAARMEKTRAAMQSKGKAYDWTLDRLAERGKSPREVGAELSRLFRPDRAYVAHYGWGFDYRVIGAFMHAYATQPFSPEHENLIDTQVLVKACLLGVAPTRSEAVRDYIARVTNIRFRGGSSLEACVDLFRLQNSGVKQADLHAACYDAWATHLILEKLRERTSAAVGGR